ncbi:MAG: glycosyltransferase [Anaerolineae bacterium]|nr:glycosyltransferase [Anaerolineae bacterium]NUQ04459.1 glycosyltransferase [Anaerolineae bacterium]
MHILIAASYYPTAENPVTGIFIEKQALALHKAGHQVGVLIAPRLSATRERLRRDGIGSLRGVTRETYFEYDADIPVYRMHWGWFPRPLPPVAALLTGSAGAAAYQRYALAHGTPDVLYAHDTFYGGYLASVIRDRIGIPYVTLEHSTSYLEGKIIFPMQPQIIRRVLRRAAVRCAVGKALAKALMRYAPEMSVQTLGNVIDATRFSPQPDSSQTTPGEPFHFTLVAGLKERRKGFDILIAALARLAADGLNVHLTIGGDGPLKAEIAAQAERQQVADRVTFAGRLTPDAVADLMRRSHAVVCASAVETFNVTIAEAMACGVPVLSTRCGGPEDFITPETGILIPPGDPAALAEGMRRMVAEYTRFDRAAARRTIVERYSEAALAARLGSIFEEARHAR